MKKSLDRIKKILKKHEKELKEKYGIKFEKMLMEEVKGLMAGIFRATAGTLRCFAPCCDSS